MCNVCFRLICCTVRFLCKFLISLKYHVGSFDRMGGTSSFHLKIMVLFTYFIQSSLSLCVGLCGHKVCLLPFPAARQPFRRTFSMFHTSIQISIMADPHSSPLPLCCITYFPNGDESLCSDVVLCSHQTLQVGISMILT